MTEAPRRGGSSRTRLLRALQILVSFGVALAIFVLVVPKIADYSLVWAAIASLTWFELATLLAVTALNSAASWPQMVVALPGLTLARSGVVNQASTAVANTLPGGGVIAVGVTYAMCRSWGFPDSSIALSTLITFVWNMFLKLGLPVVALLLLALQGKGSSGLLVGSLVGVGCLVAAIAGLALMRWKKGVAGWIGAVLGAVASFLRGLIRRPPVGDWAEAAIRFRSEATYLVATRWLPLTLATLLGHLGLYLVLGLALRDVGVSAREVSWAQVLGVFAFVRLLSALPITPGGLGIVDLGYIGGLVLAGRHQADVPMALFRAQIAAAVLVFRALTYGLQIPLGGIAYLIWQRKKIWRIAPTAPPPPALDPEAPLPSGGESRTARRRGTPGSRAQRRRGGADEAGSHP